MEGGNDHQKQEEEEIMSNNKPPMTVWLTARETPCEAIKQHHPTYAPHGPYVHLDQFLEEAKKRSKKMNRFLPEVIEIMQKEIKERK